MTENDKVVVHIKIGKMRLDKPNMIKYWLWALSSGATALDFDQILPNITQYYPMWSNMIKCWLWAFLILPNITQYDQIWSNIDCELS